MRRLPVIVAIVVGAIVVLRLLTINSAWLASLVLVNLPFAVVGEHRDLQRDPDGVRHRARGRGPAPAGRGRYRRPAQLDRAHALRAADHLQLGRRATREPQP